MFDKIYKSLKLVAIVAIAFILNCMYSLQADQMEMAKETMAKSMEMMEMAKEKAAMDMPMEMPMDSMEMPKGDDMKK